MEYIIKYWRYEGYYKEGFYDGKDLYKYTDGDIYKHEGERREKAW